MGMLGKLVTGSLLSRALRRYEERDRARARAAAGGQYVPAADIDAARGEPRSRALMGRAGDFYRRNPTLVHALAATAGAVLLTRMRRRA